MKKTHYRQKKLVECLKNTNQSLSTAESCTGGLLGNLITDIAGCSDCFKGGIIAYSNESKISLLSVPKKIITLHGAVSRQCAMVMAGRVRTIFHSDFGISITGLAGPSGSTPKKPVGLVYIGLSDNNGTETFRFCLRGGRCAIKSQTADICIDLLLKKLGR